MKVLLILAGCLMLALGAIGIFVPVLPTTPFVLVAAACFSSASPKMYQWLAGTLFGPFIENYRTGGGVPKRTKIKALICLWPLLLLSMILSGRLWVTLLLILVGAAVSTHILRIKTRH